MRSLLSHQLVPIGIVFFAAALAVSADAADEQTPLFGPDRTLRPFRGVTEWLSDRTGLPFICTGTPPIMFSADEFPKNPSPTAVIDVVNGKLEPWSMLLTRRATYFVLIATDGPIPPAAFPRVSEKELAELARTEIAGVAVPIKTVPAANMRDKVKKWLSRLGDVQVTADKTLVISDRVEKLREILDMIKAYDRAEK